MVEDVNFQDNPYTFDPDSSSLFGMLGGRKMVLALLLILVGFGAEVLMHGISATFVTLLLGVYAGFAASNVASKAVFNKRPQEVKYTVSADPKAWSVTMPEPNPDKTEAEIADVSADQDLYLERLNAILAATNTNSQALSYILDFINSIPKPQPQAT